MVVAAFGASASVGVVVVPGVDCAGVALVGLGRWSCSDDCCCCDGDDVCACC